jgi:phosphoglycolate phosphatase-like HAD superfamily hydrolase
LSRAIEAVVFDWDGTLVDSKRALVASFQETTIEVLGEPFPTEHADVERIIQVRGQEAFEEIAAGDRELYERIDTASTSSGWRRSSPSPRCW